MLCFWRLAWFWPCTVPTRMRSNCLARWNRIFTSLHLTAKSTLRAASLRPNAAHRPRSAALVAISTSRNWTTSKSLRFASPKWSASINPYDVIQRYSEKRYHIKDVVYVARSGECVCELCKKYVEDFGNVASFWYRHVWFLPTILTKSDIKSFTF